VTSRTIGNAAADRAGLLHGAELSTLGRTGGIVETATWTVPGPRNRGTVTLSLQYLASVFATPDAGAAATEDARAALWESGRPARLLRSRLLAFTVQERRQHYLIGVASGDGSLEWELTLAIGGKLDTAALARASGQLDNVAAAALQTVRVQAQALPAGQAGSGAPPPIAVAPWGTGPVVESPSLLVVPSSVLGLGAPASGSWRTGPAPLAGRAIHAAALLPGGAISAFARAGDVAGGAAGLYDVAALYANLQAAGQAFQALVAHNASLPAGEAKAFDPRRETALSGFPLDDAAGWNDHGRQIIALQFHNLLMVMASAGAGADLTALAARLLTGIPGPLHTGGTQILNQLGTPVIPVGLNWYGFDQQDFVPGGLDLRSVLDILQSFKDLGYTVIRLPFSNQLVEQNPIVSAHLTANPALQGLHALEVMDAIINQAGALGLSVILDDHRSDAGWSAQENGLWYTQDYSDTAFVQDWVTLARRYSTNDVVVGADLRNEPHGPATWGDGNAGTDWRLAAQRAGDAILAVNPNLLIMIEGVQFYHGSESYWWGGNLMGVASAPVQLTWPDGSPVAGRLVYAPHDYGPDNCGTGCPWFSSSSTPASLAQIWDQFWGYISADPGKSYAAPVLVGEFGTCNYAPTCVDSDVPGSQGQWFDSLLQYLASRDIGWMYWSANGTQSTAPARTYGALDWYGLFATNWSDPVPALNDTLRSEARQDGTIQIPVSGVGT
jgi:aryl-phospho-beta-D-glucosidase BglC (GH1 family)